MIKVIDNFLPIPIFNKLLKCVEDELFNWEWQNHSIVHPITGIGDGHFKYGMTLYVHPNLKSSGRRSHELLPLFSILKDFQDEIIPSKTIVKLKLNLYPNEGKQVKHGRHSDITNNGELDKSIITSVFNFHTCNGYTVIEKEDGTEQKVPAIANQIVIFDNTWHYGVTQSDIPRRILLNMNVAI